MDQLHGYGIYSRNNYQVALKMPSPERGLTVYIYEVKDRTPRSFDFSTKKNHEKYPLQTGACPKSGDVNLSLCHFFTFNFILKKFHYSSPGILLLLLQGPVRAYLKVCLHLKRPFGDLHKYLLLI